MGASGGQLKDARARRTGQGAKHSAAVGVAVKRIRMHEGLTQAELAGRLGKDQQQVARIEAGLTLATLDLIEELCRGLRCTPDELIGSVYGEDRPPFDESVAVEQLARFISRGDDSDYAQALERAAVRRATVALGALDDADLEALTRIAVALSWKPVRKRINDLESFYMGDRGISVRTRRGR